MSQTYTALQCLELAACTNCRACAEVCPAVQASGDAELSALYRIKGMKDIFRSRSRGLLAKLLRSKPLTAEEMEHFSSTVFRCSLCGRCQEVCPVGIHLKDIWLRLRKDLVDSEHFPKKIDMIRDNLLKSRNVFNEDNEERAEWVEDMDDPPEDLYVREQGDVVYFTGCTAAYFPVAQKIPLALARVLEGSKVSFSLLGEEEWCCGFPLLGAGLPDMHGEFALHNIEAVKKKGARDVVFACPSCYEMWKAHYPYREHGLRIHHATQYLAMLLEEGKIPLERLDMKVTYHDPCDLGRGAREFDAPRRVIRALPGVTFTELAQNRENCACCGGGGNLEMIDAGLTTEIARSKIEEALATGAEAIVTSCQQCVRTMITYVRRNKIDLKVLDITQLVLMAMPEPDDDDDD